jgi:hypothetical protein
MDESLAETFVIVVAGEREDCPTFFEELSEDLLPVPNRFAKAIRARKLAEEITGHEQHIDLLLLAMRRHSLDCFAEIVGAVDSTETVAEVPVGGMENPHAGIVGGVMAETKVRSEKRYVYERNTLKYLVTLTDLGDFRQSC